MCFTMEFIESLFIWAVIICAVVAIIRILIALVLPGLGQIGVILMQLLNIVMWAIIAIFIIYICFDLISCLISAAPKLGFPHHAWITWPSGSLFG